MAKWLLVGYGDVDNYLHHWEKVDVVFEEEKVRLLEADDESERLCVWGAGEKIQTRTLTQKTLGCG